GQAAGAALENAEAKGDDFKQGLFQRLVNWVQEKLEQWNKIPGNSVCEKILYKIGKIDPIAWLLSKKGEKTEESGVESKNPIKACWQGFRDGFICKVPDLITNTIQMITRIPRMIWGMGKTAYSHEKCKNEGLFRRVLCGIGTYLG